MKLHLNSLYGKMVQSLTDTEEKFVRKVFKHENNNHTKNCTITITQTTGKHTSISTYKLDDSLVYVYLLLDNANMPCAYIRDLNVYVYMYIC